MRFMANVDEQLDAHSYPTTTAELVEAYGEQELELADGSETFGEVVGRLGEQTFEDAEEVRLTAYSAVSEGAVGRQNYSDRDAPGIGESGHEQVSF
jgi:molybdopterin converting factor small subunit